MSIEAAPDYDLVDEMVISDTMPLRAMADPLRSTILDLLLERAATVGELAAALKRPKSTVAHHVNVLLDSGLLRVVRTRRVRAIDERYYGRVARTLYIGALTRPEDRQVATAVNGLAEAVAESAAAHAADDLRCTLVHARIPIEEVRAFWAEVQALARRFAQIPRSGDQVYGFVAGLYPTDAETLPEPGPDPEPKPKPEPDPEPELEPGPEPRPVG
jgi:DNA-binding transcriptional ArsR family regulator